MAPGPTVSFKSNNGPEHDRQHCGFQPEEERSYRRDITERGIDVAPSLGNVRAMGAVKGGSHFALGCRDTGIGYCIKSFMQTESVY